MRLFYSDTERAREAGLLRTKLRYWGIEWAREAELNRMRLFYFDTERAREVGLLRTGTKRGYIGYYYSIGEQNGPTKRGYIGYNYSIVVQNGSAKRGFIPYLSTELAREAGYVGYDNSIWYKIGFTD